VVNPLLFFPPDDIPEIRWTNQDDLCDCTFQRIGEWTNPYLAKTLRIRFCCVWEEFAKMWPDLFESIPAGYDHNTGTYVTEPMEWNGESDMPRALFYRQIQTITDKPLDEIRHKFADREPPKGWGSGR
jgi:hypothetical protein